MGMARAQKERTEASKRPVQTLAGKSLSDWKLLGNEPVKKLAPQPKIGTRRMPKEELAKLSAYLENFEVPDGYPYDTSRLRGHMFYQLHSLHRRDLYALYKSAMEGKWLGLATHAVWQGTYLPPRMQRGLIKHAFNLYSEQRDIRSGPGRVAIVATGVLLPNQPKSVQEKFYPQVRELLQGAWSRWETRDDFMLRHDAEYAIKFAYSMPDGERQEISGILINWGKLALSKWEYGFAWEAAGHLFDNPREDWKGLFRCAMLRRGNRGFGPAAVARKAIEKVGELPLGDQPGFFLTALALAPIAAKPLAAWRLAGDLYGLFLDKVCLRGNGNEKQA